jgi:hypothetical protein
MLVSTTFTMTVQKARNPSTQKKKKCEANNLAR